MKPFAPIRRSFQSTHPHGVRPLLSGGLFTQAIVSIHAPTRGATSRSIRICSRYRLFQSTHPHGVRLYHSIRVQLLYRFQSTHPHGVRPRRILQYVCQRHCFNPRTHTGCDAGSAGGGIGVRLVSIHAPTRGATVSGCPSCPLGCVSIHAPTRGAT